MKRPSHNLISQACCKIISTLPLSFSLEKHYTLECFNCSTETNSYEESICTLHSIPSVKEEEKEHMHAHFGGVAQLYHSHHICIIFV